MIFTARVFSYFDFVRWSSGVSAGILLKARNHNVLLHEVYHLRRANCIRESLAPIVLCFALSWSLGVLSIFLSHCYSISKIPTLSISFLSKRRLRIMIIENAFPDKLLVYFLVATTPTVFPEIPWEASVLLVSIKIEYLSGSKLSLESVPRSSH